MAIKTDYPNVIVDQSMRDLIASKNIQNGLVTLQNKLYVPSIYFIKSMSWNGNTQIVNEWWLNRTMLDCLTGDILVEYGRNEYLAFGIGKPCDPNIQYWIEYLDEKIQVIETLIP